LPPHPEVGGWLCVVDTAKTSPYDVAEEGNEQPIEGNTYSVKARSVVVLLAHRSRPS
jgi:hypothetical protein